MIYSGQPSGRPPAPAWLADPPFPEDPTTATRHLCAGAYLDETFRNDSLRQVYYQPRRLVAPSYGFDLVPVLGHCLRARNGALVRDGAIVGTFVVAACLSWGALLFVVSTMAGLQATIGTYRLARDTIRRLRDGVPIELGVLISRLVLLTLGWTVSFLLSVWMTAGLLEQSTDSFVEGGTDGVQSAMAQLTAGALMLSLLIFAYPVAFSMWRQGELSRLTPGVRVAPPARNARLDEIARQQRGNTAVYSGFRPYVGSGPVVASWGFAQRLVRPEKAFARELGSLGGGGDGRHGSPAVTERDREFESPPFDARELIDYVHANLSTLLPRREAEEQIAGLTVEHRILLAGTEVSHLAPNTPPDVVAAVIRHPTTPARHYLACQVFAWGGELVITVYVHIAVQGRSLYLELTTTALPPCAEDYRIVDTVEGTGTMAWLRALRDGVTGTPPAIWRSPGNLVRTLINMAAASGDRADPGRLVRGYDYGARVGVRELGSDLEMRNFTQLQDVVKYRKLIERRVVASVLDFLDARGIDTTEYRDRAASVLNVNGGVNNFGGNAQYHGPVAGGTMSNQGERT